MDIWRNKDTGFIHFKAANTLERSLLIALSSHIAQCFASDDSDIVACSLVHEIGVIEVSIRFSKEDE